MSWPAVGWAFGQTAPSSPAKFLLVTLADTASAGDWLAWPSIAYLSETTQQDRKTVIANLQKLADAGLINLVGKTGKTGQVAVWKLSVALPGSPSKSAENGTLPDDETVPFFPGNSTVFPSKESQKRDTEPVRNQSRTEKKRNAAPAQNAESLLPEVDGAVLQDWLQVRKAKRVGPVTATIAKSLRREAERAGLTHQQAVEFCCKVGWASFDADWYANRQQKSRGLPVQADVFEGAL